MDPFLGEIRLMGCAYAPRGWAFCNGQAMAINQNQALFSLLGTTYGGNGVTTFNLPDLRGRVALGIGQGPGLQNYVQGQMAGTENVTLTPAQMPQHIHPVTGTIKSTETSSGASPAGFYPANSGITQYSTGASNASLAGGSLSGASGTTGGNQGHENHQPVMAMNYCIATVGIFPSRS
jgi:microcystin-dependent protein